ncbi:DUF4175 domain-containing protein [Pseudonocardia sp. N23]|uniref:DUF4175 domain-containing protein n=1 Tax=Pseudonocardia sp. N23 TaxID=1987376 RepID=UPI001145369A|nr:DUF4175 domain-containing protein [Pseudonocardia sp. N23]
MFWFALVCGWVLTAAVIALVWINVRREGRLGVGVAVGAIGGVLWPVTLWVAVGALLLNRATNRRRSSTVSTVAQTKAQVDEAEAFAKQAEIEGMPTSAAYWRAEVQRLSAQSLATASPRPGSTGVVVLGSAVAALATLGALFVAAPTSASTTPKSPSPAASSAERPTGSSTTSDQKLTPLGNVPKKFGETASYGVVGDHSPLDFIVSEPRAAKCNSFASQPANGKFVELPIVATTHDDPEKRLTFVPFGAGWEFVGSDGRSVKASTTAAASCSYDAPSTLGPNRVYEFRVVVDVPEQDGALIYRAVATTAGWEWALTN